MDYLAKRSISCAELARRSTKIQELLFDHLMPCPRNKHIFRCDQNGPPARRSEPDWQLEGAYPERYVTDEQRIRRPIFITTLRAAASWLFFRVARSSRINFRYDRRSRLEKQPTDPATAGRKVCLFRGQDTYAIFQCRRITAARNPSKLRRDPKFSPTAR